MKNRLIRESFSNAMYHTSMKAKEISKLLIAIIVSEAAGGIGALFTTPSIPTWYAQLPKPDWTPPGWVFGPVWTTLFLLMGIAAYIVWMRGWKDREVQLALTVFCAQLVLNVMWSAIFFGLHDVGMAFGEIIVLWAVIFVTMILFFQISRPAGWLLLPYLVWVAFAGVLNGAILARTVTPPAIHTACTLEAKICPDGTAVGRSGPNCVFAPCPASSP